MWTNFWSKSYHVDAVRITKDNIDVVAKACNGEVKDTGQRLVGQPYIDMIVFDDNRLSSRIMVFIGNWVSHENGEFKAYQHEEFMKKFWTLSEELSVEEKLARVFQLVMAAMRKQDTATYFDESSKGMDIVAMQTAKQIIWGL